MGPYAQSKLEAERRISALAEESGLRTTMLRPVTLYGEGDPGNVARLMRAIDRRRFVWIGKGENRKTLIYRDDAARACFLAAGRAAGPRVEVYNLAAGDFTMREIVDHIADALGRKRPAWHIPAPVALGMVRCAAPRGRAGQAWQTAAYSGKMAC